MFHYVDSSYSDYNAMEQNPSWETDVRSANQEIVEPESSLPCSQERASGPSPEPGGSILRPHTRLL
jgi:hypothetical protein